MRTWLVALTLSLVACGSPSAEKTGEAPPQVTDHILSHCADHRALQHWLPTAPDCLQRAHGTYRLAQMTGEPTDMRRAMAAAEACLDTREPPDAEPPSSPNDLAALSLMVAAELQSPQQAGAGWLAALEHLHAGRGAQHPLGISNDALHWLALASGSPWSPDNGPKGPVRGDADEWLAWARWQLTLAPEDRDRAKAARNGPRKAPACDGLQPIIDGMVQQLSMAGPER